jgi:branched-chain amino acid transport system substrate-binding protein
MFGTGEDPLAVARKIQQAQPQALLAAALPKPFAAVLKQYRAIGGTAQAFGFSAMRIDELQAELGEQAAGVVLTQVAPAPTRRLIPIVIDYQDTLQKFAPQLKPSYHGLDAFLEARILVEALRAAGKRPTRSLVVAALEGMKNRDFGGVIVRYGPNDRTGSTYVDLLMLSAANKTVQ